MKFHYLARGIIYINSHVLLAHQKGANNSFLPGGHIGLGEKAEAALLREIAEEIGEEATIKKFIGAVECLYTENDKFTHEINLIFEVGITNLNPKKSVVSKESHLEFMWVEPTQLMAEHLLPAPMIECLLSWNSGFNGFWGSSF